MLCYFCVWCAVGGSVDVNLLLRQLLEKGLISSQSNSQTPPPSDTDTGTAHTAAAAAATGDVSEVGVRVL